MTSSAFRLFLTAPVLMALSGCDIDEMAGGNRVKEDFHHTYDLKPGGHFELESFNGAIEIRGWDQDKVDISGVKSASSQDALDEIKIDISNAPDAVRVRSVRPQGRWSNMGVSFVVTLPRKVVIDRVVSSNGGIRVEDVEGSTKLKTSNGSMKLRNVKGDLDAKTSNGSIELTAFSGGAVLQTSNGSIRASGVRGFFEATTSNGGIDASIDEAGSRPVRANTSNGKIELAIARLKDTDIIASSSNSPVVVRLPQDVGARLKATTSNGSISNAFEMKVQGEISKKRIEGTIGSGGPTIDLHTSNAPIRIERM